MIATTGFENLTLVSGSPSYILSALADHISSAWSAVVGTTNRSLPKPELGMYTLDEQFVQLLEGRDGLRGALQNLSIITAQGTVKLTSEEEYLVEESLREFDSILGEIQSLVAAYATSPEQLVSEKEATKTGHDRLLAQEIFTHDIRDLLGSKGYLGFGKHDGMRVFTSFLAWKRAKEFLALSPRDEKGVHGITAVQAHAVGGYLRSGAAAYDLHTEHKTIEALFREISAQKARLLSEA